jgi:TPR repeat protein
MKKYICVLVPVFIFVSILGFSQQDGDSYEIRGGAQRPSFWSFHITPSVLFPIGADTEFFNTGGGAGLSAEYKLPSVPLLYLSGNLGYNYIPVTFETSMSILPIGAGVGISLDLGERVDFKVFSKGGYYYAFLNDNSGPKSGNPWFDIGVGAFYYITQNISLGLQTSYLSYTGLYSGLGIGLGTAYHLPAKGKDRKEKVKAEDKESLPAPVPLDSDTEYLELKQVTFQDVFPVFFKYYDDHAVGRAAIVNNSDREISDIAVSLFVKQYMDNPKACKAPTELKAGEQSEIEINALFTERILEITEGTKVSAEITVEFTLGGERYSDSYIDTIRVYDRNALTWDDDRKAAAFVTAKDPSVLTFSKNVAGLIRDKGSKAVNQNLRMAMALYDTISLYGMSYVIDPTTPYRELSRDTSAVDFIQFPRQSFQYRAGDCDDLSILYSALLESVGVETAFITFPGHMFMAFSLDMMPEEARKSFLKPEDLIFTDYKSWVPVEVTELNGGFLRAWQTGAKQWREASARGQAGFFPIRDAWTLYEPVGLPGEGYTVLVPQEDKIVSTYLQELITFIDLEIYPKIAAIQSEINRTGGSPNSYNKLGVLYARYGLYDRAEREFKRVLEKQRNHLPALINLGNIYYLNGDTENAKLYYDQAYEQQPDNPKVLLSIARVNHEMENYGIVRQTYTRLKEVDPDLAQRFAYLDLRGDDATRAAAIGRVKEIVIWEE